MGSIYVPAWELFDRTFNEGDAVIVITEEDAWAWGELRDIGDQGALLKQGNKYRSIDWADMRFMCHDGFPIRKLKGADGSPSIEKMPSQRDLIRTVLKKYGFTELVFSDPFYIEGIVRSILYNEGHDGPEHFHTSYEEVLELVAPDGATAHLWTLNTVWHVK